MISQRARTNTYERRVTADAFTFRQQGDDVEFTGYASTFNQSYDMGWYSESVAPDAFNRTLGRRPDVRFLINHDGMPLARTTSMPTNLFLDADSTGLLVRARLDGSDPDVQSLVPKVRRGDINQMSFSFRAISDVWEDDMTKRTLRELDIDNGDVSVVTFPANPFTSAGLRSSDPTTSAAVASAIRSLQRRGASQEDVASVLTRALGYFTAIDNIVDSAQDELAEVLGIPNPDEDDMAPEPDADDAMARAATAAEWRANILRVLG